MHRIQGLVESQASRICPDDRQVKNPARDPPSHHSKRAFYIIMEGDATLQEIKMLDLHLLVDW